MKDRSTRTPPGVGQFRHRAGSALVSSLIGVFIFGGLAYGGSKLYTVYQANQSATNRAAQIGTALSAGDQYARKHETQLLNRQAVAGFADSMNPTIAELTAAGFMTSGFSDAGQNGGPVKVSLAVEPTGCSGAKCQLAVRAYPSGSIVDKFGKADQAMATKIAAAVPNGSGWSNLAGDNSKLAKNSYLLPNPLGTVPAVVVAMEWIGSNQASAVVPPVYYESNTVADCTYGGSTTYERSVTTDKWGALTYGSWTYVSDTCAAPPAPPVVTPPVTVPPPSTPPIDTPPATTQPSDSGSDSGVSNGDTSGGGDAGGGASDNPPTNTGGDSPPITPPITTPPPSPPPPLVCSPHSIKACATGGPVVGDHNTKFYMETDYQDDGTGTGTCVAVRTFQVGLCQNGSKTEF